MAELKTIGSYLQHLITARTRHSVHSPFVHELIHEVLRSTGTVTDHMRKIEALRSAMLRSGKKIRVTDLGAGSQRLHGSSRAVADIARIALKSPRQARMLHRLARYTRASNVLELGTSLGITTLYLADAIGRGQVTTVEGCPQIHHIATENFSKLEADNINSLTGAFEYHLPELLADMDALDMVFFDGDHRRSATVDLFERCASKAHDGTVFVFDDIHWSAGMEEAWQQIVQDERVTVSIDTFHLGLVFFREGQHKEHFKLRV